MRKKNKQSSGNKFLYSGKIYLVLIITIVLSSFSSCKKFVEIPPPVNQVISSQVFSNDQTATAAAVGIYSQMGATNLYFMNGAMSIYPGLSADEVSNTNTNASLDPFRSNSIPSNLMVLDNSIWRYAYIYIYQANACLTGLSASTGVTAATKQQLTGEMEFTRAICYFYLVNLFGAVPLVTTTNYKVNEVMPRTSTDLVYKQIIADLQDASNLLSPTYVSTGPTRPNKWAATALLARVYLYQSDWKDAETAASAVINSGAYSLVADLNSVFLANSPEAIWQLAPVGATFNADEGFNFLPSSATAKPQYTLNSYLLSSFEAGDQRKVKWLDSVTVGGVKYIYPYKFKVRYSATKTEYNMVLRLPELYLIRAEARAQQQNIPDAVADINMIRNRAGLPSLPSTLNQANCLAGVAQENRIEFFTEWGHRWFDLKRTGTIDNILGTEKTGWTSTAALYPIPFNEIQDNSNLTQNPGYNQ